MLNLENKIYIGIDPGLSGAIAVLGANEMPILIDTPTSKVKSGKKTKTVYIESSMASMLRKYVGSNVVVTIEKQQAMPGQGVVAMYGTGFGYGLWVGMLAALKIPYIEVRPQAWKKELMKGVGKEKSASCYRAQQMFPGIEVFTPRGRAIDGRADALLIAEYSRRNNY